MLTDSEIKDIRIGFLVKKIHLGIEKNMTLCLKEKGISPQQGRIIIILYKNQNDKINQKDLEHYFNTTKGAVSGIVNRLVAKGYVKKVKDESDNRNNYLSLTQNGVNLYKVIRDSIDKTNEKILSCLTSEESINLKKYLLKVLEGLDND